MTGCKKRIRMDVIYLNFRKVFGLVSYISLVAKLGSYALDGCTTNRRKSWLDCQT